MDAWHKFIRRAVATAERIELCVIGAMAEGSVLERVALPLEQGHGDDELGALAAELHDAAQADCDALGGVSRYALIAVGPDGEARSRAVRLRPRIADQFESEPATEKGLLAQMMRHTEACMRQATVGSQAQLGALTAFLERTTTRLEQLEQERFATLALVEDLTSRRHERELAERQAAEDSEQKAKALDMLRPLVPVVAAKLTGKALPPHTGAPDPQREALAALVQTLSPEQLAAIQSTLTPAQSVAFLELAKEHLDEPRRRTH